MAGHSKFANIKHRKGAQDAKRAKAFTKLAREIIVSVKTGMPEPENNPRLRSAIAAARAMNMTNDRIHSAIKQGMGNQPGDDYEEMRYEGYGPKGIAVIVEALTNNRNRTASEVRSAFTKHGGNLGETGSVAFSFEQVGLIEYPAATASEEEMLEAAIEAGADNCESDEFVHSITCKPDDFSAVRGALEEKFGEAETGRLSWNPANTVEADEDTATSLMKLVETLEDNDDVQYVVTNADISDEIMEKLAI
ncbi:MAG: YebC/PmpR family DNA-binding transcriptional regulator [Alphaproteobacteria bacterium CG11_big_fil_rev_8_21_14_0_20_44_7]|nr:MAG: YebC/PmpR family DNA-binding transcriptional regulator [Alphaproteobacteria bacterium CG11_big_fil_rev_8_21_14_0_20_44_7]